MDCVMGNASHARNKRHKRTRTANSRVRDDQRVVQNIMVRRLCSLLALNLGGSRSIILTLWTLTFWRKGLVSDHTLLTSQFGNPVSRVTADHGGYKFIAYVLTMLPHILNLQ